MIALLKIINKNFKLLIRSKSSALIIILGPLLVIFLVGVAFDNLNKFSLNIGTYSEEYSELSESFITKLEAQEFQVKKIDSIEDCTDQIKQGKLNICVVFPKGLVIEAEKSNEIEFHVDNSKINLVWMVLETISSKLDERSSELSTDLTANLLNKIDLTKNELYGLKPTIVNLKTDNQLATDTIVATQTDILDAKFGEVITKTTNLKTGLLEKVTGAETTLNIISRRVNGSNLTDDEVNSINVKINEVNTYLFGMKLRLGVAGSSPNSEYGDVDKLLNEVDAALRSGLSSTKSKLSSLTEKINTVQSSVDTLYDQLSSIRITDAATIVNPITTVIKPVTTEKSNLNFLFPSLIVLVIMFISILLSNTLVMMEKHSPAYFRNFITPTKDIVFILATYLTNVLLVFLQLAIILGISFFFFKAQVLSAIPATVLILLLTITFFTFVGMIIGYLFTSEETSTLAAISIGSIFLFLSNVILPLESMPSYVRNIAQFNPFVLGESLLRKAIIFQVQIPDLWFELVLLLAYSVVLFLAIWGSQKIVRKHLFHKLAYKIHKRAKAKKAKKLAKK